MSISSVSLDTARNNSDQKEYAADDNACDLATVWTTAIIVAVLLSIVVVVADVA